MFAKFRKNTPILAAVLVTAGSLASCGNINNSWEVKGGGYIKYSVNGSEKYTIELEAEDCILTSVNRHYIQCTTQMGKSKRGDQISFWVNNPSTSGKIPPVATAIINGKNQDVSWMRQEFSDKAHLIPESSYVNFDEIIRDSLWTAKLELYFKDCRSGTCSETASPVHISGRFRYWVSADER